MTEDEKIKFFNQFFQPNGAAYRSMPYLFQKAIDIDLAFIVSDNWQFSDALSATNRLGLKLNGFAEARRLGFVCSCVDCNNLCLKGSRCVLCQKPSALHDCCDTHVCQRIQKERIDWLIKYRGFNLVSGFINRLERLNVPFYIDVKGISFCLIRTSDDGCYFEKSCGNVIDFEMSVEYAINRSFIDPVLT